MLEGKAIQDIDDAVGVDPAIDLDGGGFTGQLVDQVSRLHGAAIGSRVELKVRRPESIRTDR